MAPIPRRSFFSSLGQESTWQCKAKQYGFDNYRKHGFGVIPCPFFSRKRRQRGEDTWLGRADQAMQMATHFTHMALLTSKHKILYPNLKMIPYHLGSLRLATERRLKEERGNETEHWPYPPPPSSVLPFFFLPHITTLSPFWLSKKNIRSNVLLPRSVK